MKSAKILLALPLLTLLAGCVTTSEQPKSAAQSASAAQAHTAFVPVMGSGGSSGFQQFRR